MKNRIRNSGWKRTANRSLLAAPVTCAIAACLALIIAVGLHANGWLRPIERAVQQARFSVLDRAPSGEIVFVDIDASSLQHVGVWPWPRSIHARIIDRLRAEGAAEIFYDVDFSSASNAEEDAALAQALERAEGRVHLAVFRQLQDPGNPESRSYSNVPLPAFLDHAWPVSVSIPLEVDGRVWRAGLADLVDGETVLTLSAMLAGVDGRVGDKFGIDFAIDPAGIPRLPARALLTEAPLDVSLAGRKVVVGASAQELRDLFVVPVHGIQPGGVVQILAAESLLAGRPISGGYGYWLLAAVLLAASVATLSGIVNWRSRILLFLVLAIALEAWALLVQVRHPVSLDTGPAQVTLLVLALSVLLREIGVRQFLFRMMRTARENDKVVLDQLFADSFDGVIVVDADGIIRAASRSAAGILGTDVRVGEAAEQVLPNDIMRAVRSALAQPSPAADASLSETQLPPESGSAENRVIEFVVTCSDLAPEDGGEAQKVACLTCRNVTDRRHAEEQLAYLAAHDPVTDLLDRRAFETELTLWMARRMERDGGCWVLVLGLERVDIIGASLGLAMVDGVRATIARRLQHLECEILGSVGDLRFAIACAAAPPEEFCKQLQTLVEQEVVLEGHRLHVGASIGIALIPPGKTSDAAAVLRQAGTALSLAQKAGAGSVRCFDAAMDQALTRRRLLEIDLEEGLSRGEFQVVYQPQIDLVSRQLVGVEALLRWTHPVFGEVSPGEFIPIAEESGLIEQLGAFVLTEACRTLQQWGRPLRLAVNVSPIQVQRGSIGGDVERALAASGFPASRLDLELVESLFLGQAEAVSASIAHLCRLGCGLALDDFGSGYSSLGYIPRFPFSKIKIDRSFIQNVHKDKGSAAIVRSVVELARGFDIQVIAEGIETPEQDEAVRALGCDFGQGFLYGRPMSADQVMKIMRTAA
ncbi:EAL domain-containing protein [Pannonibacter sp.]|uniref:EAL domain-containing protein n=1 Tax=Pannonibacter sp. TaxID=1906786 RepID=UPI003F70A070